MFVYLCLCVCVFVYAFVRVYTCVHAYVSVCARVCKGYTYMFALLRHARRGSSISRQPCVHAVEREQMFLLLICRASTKQLSPRIFPQCPYITTHSSYFKIPTAAFPVPGFPVLDSRFHTNHFLEHTLSQAHEKKREKKIEKKRTDRGEKMLTLLIMIIPAALKSRNALLIYGMYL